MRLFLTTLDNIPNKSFLIITIFESPSNKNLSSRDNDTETTRILSTMIISILGEFINNEI